MPDLDLIAADGPLRAFELLHDTPLLLNLGEPGEFDITPGADRVQLIDASYEGEWELPVIGLVSAPTAVLIRPDGYVAWVERTPRLGYLTRWPPGSGRLPKRVEHLARRSLAALDPAVEIAPTVRRGVLAREQRVTLTPLEEAQKSVYWPGAKPRIRAVDPGVVDPRVEVGDPVVGVVDVCDAASERIEGRVDGRGSRDGMRLRGRNRPLRVRRCRS